MISPHDGRGGLGDIEWFALAPDGQGRVGLLWVILNFGILLIVLNWLVFSKLRAGHRRERERIRGELERATRAREEAEALMASYADRLGELEGEIEAIRDQARQSAESERREIVAAAERQAEEIRGAAVVAAEREAERRRRELEAELVDRAVAAAERALRGKVTAQDQHRMVDDHVAEIGGARLHGERVP